MGRPPSYTKNMAEQQKTVWFTERCEYDSFVCGVYSSAAAAVSGLKARYGPPYIVDWGELAQGDDDWYIKASFERVLGYSTEHKVKWLISERVVDKDVPPMAKPFSLPLSVAEVRDIMGAG